MMGEANIANPIADGIVSKNASRIPRARIARNSSMFPTAALFDTSGSVTVTIAHPEIPSGHRIQRKQTVKPPTNCYASNNGTEIKIARCHGWRAEDMFRVEHAHHQRRKRHE